MTKNTIENAKKLLRSGELVIFPTETVYGLGGNANDKNAIKRIYNIKKRPANNPIICHFESLEEIKKDFHFLLSTEINFWRLENLLILITH